MIVDQELIQQLTYLGHQELLKNVVCFSEYCLIYQDKLQTNIIEDMANTIKQKKLPVLNFSVNPYLIGPFYKQLLEYFAPDDFFILNSDCRQQENLHKNIAPWPAALLWQQSSKKDYTHTLEKKFRISFLMRETRLHRLALFAQLKSHVTEQDVVVANNISSSMPIDVGQSLQAKQWLTMLPWASKSEFFDLDQKSNLSGYNFYTSVDHPAYQAKVNITNESCHDDNISFISEKTWKAYASSCLIINYGSSQVPSQLKEFGFGIWEEYDLPISYNDKIKYIVELFDRNDIDDLYQKNLDMIYHNQQLVTSYTLAKKLTDSTVEKIKNLF